MTKELGRNDPCYCGSGKKYKACCWAKNQPGKKKFSAKLLGGKINLMERAYGGATSSTKPLSEVIKSPKIGPHEEKKDKEADQKP